MPVISSKLKFESSFQNSFTFYVFYLIFVYFFILFAGSNCVVPINDIRGVESMGYAKGEKILRCKLAAVYRLIDLYGWAQSIYNHITVRILLYEFV